MRVIIIIIMFFKEDSIEDFINYKLSNPQALQDEMKMIKDRQDCTRKLNQYAKQMQNLKNEFNMYQELLDASLAKKQYIQQTYEENKVDLDDKIAKCKEETQSNNREIKERQTKNQFNRKKYNDFQKEIAVKKDQLTEYHLTELTSLSNYSENLKKNIEQKKEKREKLQEELRELKDRQKIIQDTVENSENVKNKWINRKRELQKMREEQIRKQKQIRDQINNAISMQKVIYGNFYKRCAQITAEMRNGLDDLFDKNFNGIDNSSNLQQKLQKILLRSKANKEKLLTFILQKRQKYKIGTLLPEADAQTKINPGLLTVINPSDYRNNDLLLKEIENGLQSMFEQLEAEKRESFERQKMKAIQIQELEQRVKDFQNQIQAKRKQLLSPSKKSRKN